MNKLNFLKDQHVQNFIEWIKHKLDQKKSFLHSYKLQKNVRGQEWFCDSIYSAFENYKWNYVYTHPTNQNRLTGCSFIDSEKALNELSKTLREAIETQDDKLCVSCCMSILEWGGILSKNKDNIEKIKTSKRGIANYLKNVQHRLSLSVIDLEKDCEGIIMNAGFSKIYSLIISDFVIYDGRVGAALGLLVRKYCEDNSLLIVPEQLRFSYGNSRTVLSGIQNRRNPSTEKYKFFSLNNSSLKHIQNNIKANWLAKEIVDRHDSRFKSLHMDRQLRAFEAALFMIGYDVSQEP
ncbi:hypothetical protein J2I47_12595 [Fibrella sp. HMF5335]|uniref:Uncharacterized protein n=1 Tax=Fibrella rubiginis TaxID=2817060 RepID=A0A939K1Q3_9BACT|nr:hypothetical protein [Fibrella rubiginis]MBO0937387.1 hypothetical protein [Fibrella rubiginis]